MKLTTIKSARRNATTIHLGENTGWSSLPFCGAMETGKREVNGIADGTANCRPCIAEANRRYLDIEGWIFIGARLRALIDAVREHAVANYNTGAWDIIVEAYSDSELAEQIRSCQTARGAIRKVARIVELYADRRAFHSAEIAAATEPVEPREQPEAAEYDRFAEGAHPDGSTVRWGFDQHSGDSWATRTWAGKACKGHISIEQVGPDGDYVTIERYAPAWRGAVIESANLCYGLPF